MPSITPSLSATVADGCVDVSIDLTTAARVVDRDGTTTVWIAMLGGDRCIDVSMQPRTVPTMLRREARRRREDGNRWCTGLARLLFDEAVGRGIGDLPVSDRDDLEALLASLTFPLARQARAQGAGPVPHVPRWAGALLREQSAAAAVALLCGPGASRALIRALPEGMIPPVGAPASAAPDLRPLGLAVSLAEHLPADRLATVLAGGDRWLPPQHWPTDDDVRELSRLWAVTDAPTATALAIDACRVDFGVRRLRRALTIVERLASVAELAVARTVVDLERQAEQAVPRRPAEPPARPRPARARRPAPEPAVEPAPAPRRDPLPAQPRYPPRNDGPGGGRQRFTYPPTVGVAHGYQVGDHRFVLPQSPAELTQWGRRLSNCIGDYAGAVRSGRSVILGLEDRGRLVAALELRDNTVRQFVSMANGRPSPALRQSAERMLRDLSLGGR